jgi:hypothetical protein
MCGAGVCSLAVLSHQAGACQRRRCCVNGMHFPMPPCSRVIVTTAENPEVRPVHVPSCCMWWRCKRWARIPCVLSTCHPKHSRRICPYTLGCPPYVPIFLQGVYCVAFYKSGTWVPVIIDDRFPVLENCHVPPPPASGGAGAFAWLPLQSRAAVSPFVYVDFPPYVLFCTCFPRVWGAGACVRVL